MRSKWAVLVALALAALAPIAACSREELLDRVRSGRATVLDVRPAEEFAAGHIPGALSIPVDELTERIAELPDDTEIVAYCRGAYCVLAYDAVRLLREQGRTAVRLTDGMLEWRLAELPEDGLVFPAPRGGWARRSNYGRSTWDPAAVSVDWPRGDDGHWLWTFHSLRHVFATWALDQPGLRVEDVSRLLGHSSTRVTQEGGKNRTNSVEPVFLRWSGLEIEARRNLADPNSVTDQGKYDDEDGRYDASTGDVDAARELERATRSRLAALATGTFIEAIVIALLVMQS